MTKFNGGPANGQTLMLKRAPKFLRVTLKNERGKAKFDALDNPDDTPEAAETLMAYERFGLCGQVHLNMGRFRGGFYALAEYRYVLDQPSDLEMRNSVKWEKWCEARPKA